MNQVVFFPSPSSFLRSTKIHELIEKIGQFFLTFKMEDQQNSSPESLSRVQYRIAAPTDIFQCFQLEQSWKKSSSKNDLQYRQHHAAPYFRCAVLETDDDEDDIIGFICSTRLEQLQDIADSTLHRPNGIILMIHSFVVAEEYRRQGVGKLMLENYLKTLRVRKASVENPINEVALYAKAELLTFFLHLGFSVVRPCTAVEGKEQLYLLQINIRSFINPMGQGTGVVDLARKGNECYVVDSFAAKPGTGNPAGVVLLPPETNSDSLDKWMQTVAAEFNLSETAFCWPQSQQQNSDIERHWNIRFYTPRIEVSLCGHATLASAAVLYQTLQPDPECFIVFHAREDTLKMKLATPSDNSNAMQTKICMHFPSKPPKQLTLREEKSAVQKMMEAAFSCNIEPLYIGISDIGDVLIELTPELFRKIGYERINYKSLLQWDGYFRGVIICCVNDGERMIDDETTKSLFPDFLSRFFGMLSSWLSTFFLFCLMLN
jgi:GNAT superfamily N-acetyltransferase